MKGEKAPGTRSQPGRDQRHEQVTRQAAVALTVAAATGSTTSMITYLAELSGAYSQEGPGGLIPVVYLAAATALLASGLTARTPDRRRRSLWAAALLLTPAAVYLLPVWWLSVPLITGAVGAGLSAFLVGHRQRCQRIRRAA